MGARFGFRSGSRPLASLRLDASNPEQMDLSRPSGCKFGLSCLRLAWRPSSLGAGWVWVWLEAWELWELWEHWEPRPTTAHSCLWDRELCRPSDGFGLQSCLACRLPRIRPARRRRARPVQGLGFGVQGNPVGFRI